MTSDSAIRLPEPRDTALLVVAIAAISTSAPIIAACTAPALAIAFWRSAFGAAAMTPWAARRGFPGLRACTPAELRYVVLAGVLLGAHFAAWIPSLRFTSVASSTALVATQPVWAALIARARGARVDRGVWVGIVIALAGVLVLTGIDFSLDPRSLIGDALALLGAILAAAYVTVTERARQSLDTSEFTSAAYAVSAVTLLPLCLLTGSALTGYSTRDWLLILLLTLLAQLLGHAVISVVLRTTSATVVSLAILFELPGAILVAAVFLGQLPPVQILPALVLLGIGLVVVIRAGRSDAQVEATPD